MSKKLPILIGALFVLGALLVGEFFLVQKYACPTPKEETPAEETVPKAMMLLIEFRNTDGLVNMVSDMKERNVKGILMVNADFVQANQETIREILKTGVIEIAASYDPKPYWEMTYDEQYEVITDMVTRIESMLNIKVRIISSRYMASDENTVKIADELGIEYITARGTTELATTVYKPEEYNVKIISVSNIDVPEFKYGSFCDYSFYERNGSPEDMTTEFERAITEEKFIGVSHTYIGGQKARWNNMWHNFWDNYNVDWVDLDTLGTVDKVLPMWQIPININAPYTPEKIRPAIPYEDEQDVVNPCKVDDLNESDGGNGKINQQEIVIFHNNTGPMCVDLLAFLDEYNLSYEEHLTTDSDFSSVLGTYKSEYPESEGVSTTYGYYPFIFVDGKAFSGFNSDIEAQLKTVLDL
ncbi:polysaccharide deacetylase family protein [Candidatus Dojkabacteria bacterium]|nr:polysaccharide deacetylase family protein [Candidatus Dojkabacteria bacterium]